MSVDAAALQARVQALEAELAAARADMQHFAYAVSHDLRAPLRHIVSYVQLVQEDAGEQLEPEVQGFLGTITDSARHLGVLLDGLAAWSRVGTAPVQLQAVDLYALVCEVCESLLLPGDQAAPQWTIAPDLPTVWADAALLRQALEQVLGNAVKFSAKSSPACIAISAYGEATPSLAGLCVQDHGAGFNPAQQAALFKVFGRLHSAQQFSGIGMGLATARRIAERLGGRVTLESEGVGQGAKARLVLPVEPQ